MVDAFGREKLLDLINQKTKELTGFSLVWEEKPIEKFFDISTELALLEDEKKNFVNPMYELYPTLHQLCYFKNVTDYQIAKAIKEMFPDFICSGIKKGIWYGLFK